jgi:hypothetical protein
LHISTLASSTEATSAMSSGWISMGTLRGDLNLSRLAGISKNSSC